MTPADRAHWTAALAELRAKVPAATLTPAWQAGAAAPLEQVLTRTGLLPPQAAPAWHGGGG